LQAEAARTRQPQRGGFYNPVPSCGRVRCTAATADKVTAGMVTIQQTQQLYNSMPGPSVR
jgi:hypothetical protein